MHNVNLTNCNLKNTIFAGVKNILGEVVVENGNSFIDGLVMPKGLNYILENYNGPSDPVSSQFIKNVTTFDYSIENNIKRLL